MSLHVMDANKRFLDNVKFFSYQISDGMAYPPCHGESFGCV